MPSYSSLTILKEHSFLKYIAYRFCKELRTSKEKRCSVVTLLKAASIILIIISLYLKIIDCLLRHVKAQERIITLQPQLHLDQDLRQMLSEGQPCHLELRLLLIEDPQYMHLCGPQELDLFYSK